MYKVITFHGPLIPYSFYLCLMRIIGHIEHPVFKITVMQMAEKFVLKVEHGLLEQTFKIREADEVRGYADVAKLVDAAFLEACTERFQSMNTDLFASFQRNLDWNP